MLKNCGAALALAALIALGGLAFHYEVSSPKPLIKQNAEVHDPCTQSDEKSIEGCTNVRIANYTYWLAVFTALLAVVSLGQITFLVRADKTARISADAAKIAAEAAKKSADALPNIERAYLFVRLNDWDSGPGRGKLRILDYGFENHGKTPAIVHEIRVGFRRSNNSLDSTEWASCANILSRERVVAQGVFDRMNFIEELDELSIEEAALLAGGGLFIYFFGCVTYSDVFSETHETQFAFRLHRTELRQWGGNEHNRRT